jgi:DNA-binding response OmpR family regulator
MRQRIFVVSWHAAEAEAIAHDLRAAGYAVATETEDGGRAFAAIRAEPPAAVIVDLRRRPSHGRAVIESLQETAGTRALPVLVLDEPGDVAQPVVERLRAILPD